MTTPGPAWPRTSRVGTGCDERVPASGEAVLSTDDLHEPDDTEVEGCLPWWWRLPGPSTLPVDPIFSGTRPTAPVEEEARPVDRMVRIGGIENELQTVAPCADPYEIPPNRRCRGHYDTECALLPCLNATSTTDPCADNSRAAAATDRLGFTDCTFAGLLGRAWCLLEENSDLMLWVVCMLWDTNVAASFVGNVLHDPFLRVRCSLDAGSCSPTINSPTNAYTGPFLITICLNSGEAVGWRTALGGTAGDRLCATIHAASLLFHELLHAFALVGIDNLTLTGTPRTATVTDCGVVDAFFDRRGHMAENTLRWALLQRFTAAQSSSFCSFVNPGGGHFMNPTPHGING